MPLTSEIFAKRYKEYIGSAPYLYGYGKAFENTGNSTHVAVLATPENLKEFMEKELDLFRSIRQRSGYLVILDIEYNHFGNYHEVYTKPKEIFDAIKPLCTALELTLERKKIAYLKIMTGQGYHYACVIEEEFLDKINRACYPRVPRTVFHRYSMPPRHENAHASVGKLAEFLYHKSVSLYRAREGNNSLKIMPHDFHIGAPSIGFDLTAWPCPLATRIVRLPFSPHQKHKMNKYIKRMGANSCENLPIAYSLPCNNLALDECLEIRRNKQKVMALASIQDCTPPRCGQSWLNLAKEYRSSKLQSLHVEMEDNTPQDWEGPEKAEQKLASLATDSLSDNTKSALAGEVEIRWTHVFELYKAGRAQNLDFNTIASIAALGHHRYLSHGARPDIYNYDSWLLTTYWVRVFHALVREGLM